MAAWMRRAGATILPTICGPLALAAEVYSHRELAIALASFAAGGPVTLAPLGRRIESGSRFDRAMENALLSLFAYQAKPEEKPAGLLLAPSSSDATTPTIRATSFVPLAVDGVLVMRPHRRVTSLEPHKILRWPRDFETKATFKRGDPYVGECWSTGTEVYRPIRALVDFEASCDDDRYKVWSNQFATNISTWSSYMQKVRAIWAFPIWGVGKIPMAIVSLDSTIAGAFEVPVAHHSSNDARLSPKAKKQGKRSRGTSVVSVASTSLGSGSGGSVFAMTIRDATAATMAGWIYAALDQTAKSDLEKADAPTG